MLQELMKSNMKGLDFSEIRRQEVIRYVDNVATIADTDFKRKVEARVDQMNIELEAREQFEKEIMTEKKIHIFTYDSKSNRLHF